MSRLASAEPKKKSRRRKAPVCKRCKKTIRVPAGWSVGPAVRKHYWRHHRDHMQANLSGGAR
ncbi:MAG: hypothetical protein ACR2KQ_02270 [Actinomycetota bacterium]